MKRVLALDGGGLRGIISLGLLSRLEERLGGAPLGRHFDLIGGTSTGAVIATGLALGKPVHEIRDFYTDLAPQVFRRRGFRLPGIHALFDEAPMEAHIRDICGARTLESPDLVTSLALFVKRLDTDIVWTVTNSPESPFWDDPADGSYIGNRHYRLADLVRAATAAPHYFDPEPIPVARDDHGIFIDAGVTPYNNPALAMLKLVSAPGQGFCWPLGADRLRIVSVGTGAFRNVQPADRLMSMRSGALALNALLSAVRHGGQMIDDMLALLGRNARDGAALLPEPLFEFLRLDVRLERDWLARELGLDVSEAALARLRRMDDTTHPDLAWEIGRRAGKRILDALEEEEKPAWT
jgi:uncharacterized protein